MIGGLAAFMFVPPLFDYYNNAVVRDAPFAPSAEAKTLHDALFVADFHSDSLLWNRDLLVENARGHVDLPRLAKGNDALQVFSVVTKTPKKMNFEMNSGDTDNIITLAIMQRWPRNTYSSLLERAIYQAEKLHATARRSNGALTVITSGRGLDAFLDKRNENRNAVAGILSIEGMQCAEGKLDNIQTLYSVGFRMMGITHFFDNELGGSAHGVSKGGLTPFGRDCVKKMEELHILVDVAHASPAVIDDVLAMATRPVVLSHGGVKGTCNNVRNISDEHIKGIAKTGGVVGVAYFDTAVCGNDVKAIVAAIRYVADIGGIDHVGLGSDFDGVVTTPFDTAGLAEITEELRKQGVPGVDIAKIMGGNALRLLRQSLPES
ncbi:MAG: dipeptidase [Candidatus Hydrogenedentes bacterium]|nr:dipeptidase [Candidatus Hydrogenedentota bacterium]